jgi:cell wall-associated NlpC family hydrolase
MQWYFDNQSEVERLGNVLRSWENTPYRHYMGVKKRGVDCIHFLLRVYEEIGIVERGRIRIPYYPPDWHLHREDELLKTAFLDDPQVSVHVEQLDAQAVPLEGDIVIMKYGKVDSHSGIFFGGRLWHAITRIGVQSSIYCDKMWAKRRRASFRIKAK